MLSFLFLIFISNKAAALSEQDQLNLQALGVVYHRTNFQQLPELPAIAFFGTAFRVQSQTMQPTWATAAHVTFVGTSNEITYVAPAWQNNDGQFQQSKIAKVNGKSVSNFDQVNPNLYFSFSSEAALVEAEQRLSIPWVRSKTMSAGPGSDLVTLPSQNGNFSEKGSYYLRSLKQRPLEVGEKMQALGYPHSANGIPQNLDCDFKGFSVLNGGFRGILFCNTSLSVISGMSGGPVLDEANRVIGTISSQLLFNVSASPKEKNLMIYFTPLIERDGGILDGLNAEEISNADCVAFALGWRFQKSDVRKTGKCALTPQAPVNADSKARVEAEAAK